jgi:alpha-ribazole phosphatase
VQLFLVRHPRPARAAGLCYGRLDLELESGALEATAPAVRASIPTQDLQRARVVSSPARRCAELARALALPAAPELAAALQELDFGRWEGLSWDSIPRAELDAWAADPWRYRPGGAESAADVAVRWIAWCAAQPASGEHAAVIVTHAGLIRVALCCAGLLEPARFASRPIPFGSVHRLELAASAPPLLHRMRA